MRTNQKIGIFTSVILVMAIMVDTGIYTSLGLQLLSISSAFTILTLWVLAGIGALCGALSYAELASLMPHSGGEYYYLSKIYHPAVGTMAGIIGQLAGFSAPIALASMAFGKYFQALFPSSNAMLSSIILVTVVTGAHLFNLRYSAIFQNSVTGLKFLLIAIFLYVGFRYATITPKIFLPSKVAIKELFHPSSGVVLVFCFYAYSGWNSSIYIADDVVSARRNVGRSLIIGSLLVILIYLLMNVVFLMAAPLGELRGVLDIGRVVAFHLLGQEGGYMMAGLIAVGLIAGVSGMAWLGPHITQMMGRDLPALCWLAPVSKSNIPLRAMFFQYILVLLMLMTSSFKAILISAEIPLIFCNLLGVVGVVILRWKHHKIDDYEGFKCPFYPLPPLLFATISMIALIYTMITNPMEGIIGVTIIIGALLLYPLFIIRAT
ncbi:MAG: hypothetical protein A3F67_03440 [Verrucomicrobia bacterium RIFCSPHIGHO2_12_FULL_41_10]|nr:MAG: hypothetical protein A3F67_03440 [Verrucomicrobia bacterium RIFCSPHIGHO2_12_FULL_41_10]HLB34863.1 amino acid permease [Chthoniobacterales bacterium]